ncbi:MAG: hypothetical protein ACFFDP_06440 [Promethearchaeota archaeon]
MERLRKIRCSHEEGDVLYVYVGDNPENEIEGLVLKCSKCGAMIGHHFFVKPRKGAKLFNEKGQWVGRYK